MHVSEIDFRSTPLRTLCTATTNSIEELIEFSKNEIIDGLTAMEYAEYFHGAALVACQAYAVGTVSDINIIRESNGKPALSKLALYKAEMIKGQKCTFVELINSLANCFKHNEEWSSWPVNETTKTLRHFGLNETTEFPLYAGIREIIGESTDLCGLCEVLEGWRVMQIEKWCRNA